MGQMSNREFFNSEAAKNKATWKQADGDAARTLRVRNAPNPKYNYATGLFQDVVHYQRPNMFPYLTATAEVSTDTAIRTAPISEVVNTPRVASSTTEPVKVTEPIVAPVTNTVATKTPIISSAPRLTSPIGARELPAEVTPLPQVTTVMPSVSRSVGNTSNVGFSNTETVKKKNYSLLWLVILTGTVFGAYKILK